MPEALEQILGPHEASPVAGGDICRAFRVKTPEGVYFAKTPRRPDPHMLTAEAWGIAQLNGAVAGLCPEVIHADTEWLVLEWITQTAPSVAGAHALGRRLATLHAQPADGFGHGHRHGRIGALPMPSGNYDSWPAMYADLRIQPLLDAGLPNCAALAEALRGDPDWAGPAEPPSLLHGDLWSGNILWSTEPMVVDPACHSGHRETDLGMLALFGTPYLDQILAAYQEVHPLAIGWQGRVPLHQLWPLLVHHRLFGGGYGARAEQIARGYLR